MERSAAEALAAFGDVVESAGRPLFFAIDLAGDLFPASGPFDGAELHPLFVAAGIVATGKAHRLDEPDSEPIRVRLSCIVHRSGEVDWVLVSSDPEVIPEASSNPTEGVVLDMLKSVMGVTA